MPGGDGGHQRIEIHHIGAAEQDEGGTPAHARERLRAEEPLVLAGDGGDDEYEIAFAQDLIEACRLHAVILQDRARHPGIEHLDLRPEAGKHAVQGLAEIAEADNADIGAG